MNKLLLSFFIIVLFNSCYPSSKGNKLKIDMIKSSYPFSIFFSHSIMGETHPCGCRHHPLGGIIHLAEAIHDLKGKKDFLYIDTGDMLFPSSVIHPNIKESLSYTAKNLVKALSKIGLKYMVLGEQDLSLGLKYLEDILKETQVKLLLSNLANQEIIKHQNHVILKLKKKNIYFIGITDPVLLPTEYKKFFIPPLESLPQIILNLKKIGYNSKKDQIILLSHSGMKTDENIALKFPQISWIIGGHSNSFTKDPFLVNKTKIVQVLSKNHYIRRNKNHQIK